MAKLLSWFNLKMKMVVAITLAAIIGGTTTAVVLAAVPDASGVIHGCYTAGLFAKVRIIDSATTNCSAAETALNWNQAGVKGKGQVLANRLILSAGDAPATLLVIPGFGAVKVDPGQCNANQATAPIDFLTSASVTFPGSSNSPYGSGQTVSLVQYPGQVFDGNISSGFGAETHIARLTVSSTADQIGSGPDSCTYTSTATIFGE